MNKKILILIVLLTSTAIQAQVGIGTLNPNKSSQLDINAVDKGVLLPRVNLKSTTDATTISNGNENSLLIFNNSNQSDVTPGYYYWYNDQWMRIVNDQDIKLYDTNTKNVSLSILNEDLILTDSENNSINISLKDINIPSVLIDNNDGTYTYTNELGSSVTIDIPAKIINNINSILTNTTVLNELIDILGDTHIGGNVYFDGSTFTYVDEHGIQHNLNIVDIIKANETVTSISQDVNSGVITYKDEKNQDTLLPIGDLVRTQQKNISIVDGTNSNVSAITSGNHTEYKINVATANGSNLGLVKEATTNPTILINQSGELSVNLEKFNAITEVNADYTTLNGDVILLGDASTNDITILLPNAQDNKGKKITIKKDDNNENYYVNVVGNIKGTNQLYTALPYSGWDLVSDGLNWRVVSKF